MKYAALMFDIVESKRYGDIFGVQTIMMQNIDYLNHVYRDGIKKEVVPSAGDEYQGLFLNLETAFLYVRKLQLLVYPIKIRSGIGYGEIEYDVNEWASSAFNGRAYYLARDAINSIPKRKGNIVCFNTDSIYDKYINMYCLANADIKSRQSQIARWVELLADVIAPITPIWEDIGIYHFILENRIKIVEQELWDMTVRKSNNLELFSTDFEFLFHIKSSYEVRGTNTNHLYIDNFWEHGMATDIAHAMRTSRQNIDRYVGLGKIKESRTMDKTIFEMLGEGAR